MFHRIILLLMTVFLGLLFFQIQVCRSVVLHFLPYFNGILSSTFNLIASGTWVMENGLKW